MNNNSDIARLLDGLDVSRETIRKLEIYEHQLLQWQRIKNLVAPSTLEHLWSRHFEDSIQLLRFAPNARNWLDLGSGAGFPGLVIAAALSHRTDGVFTLVESDHRKCAFLRETARAMEVTVNVVHARIEDVVQDLRVAEIVTARALTALPKLLHLAMPQLEKGAIGYFLKGQDVEAELTEDPIFSILQLEFLPCLTNSGGKIVRVNAGESS